MEKSYQFIGPNGKLRKLTLDDRGLRYEIGSRHYNLGWDGVHHRIERTGLGGAVRSVILVTRNGKWFALGGFEDMPGIAATVRQRVPTSGPQGVAEKLFFHPWFNPICLALGLRGLFSMYMTPPLLGMTKDQQELIAWALLTPSIIVSLYTLPRNPLFTLILTGQKGPGGMTQRFFTSLLVWIALVVAVLFILNFVVPRLH